MPTLNTTFKHGVNRACINGLFTPATICRMNESFSRLVQLAASGRRVAAVVGDSAIALALNESPQTVYNWKKRGVSKEGAIKASTLFGGAVDYILYGTGGENSPLGPGIAQDMSQARATLTVQKKAWGQLMADDLSQPFELDVIDGAFGADIPPGCVMRLDPHRKPRPGWPVLVKTGANEFYLRDYQEVSAGRWQAVARVRGFAPLDSVDDRLQVIAVMKGVDYP